MPTIVGLLLVAIATIAGAGGVSYYLAQERNARLYREIDADIREMLRQQELRKFERANPEPTERADLPLHDDTDRVGTTTSVRTDPARAATIATAAASEEPNALTDATDGKSPDARAEDAKLRNEKIRDARARKAKISSIRKRAAGLRRERLVPPDFARLPTAILRGIFP
jgi:hypothetical protein